MKPAPFRYFAPTTIAEALALLAEHGDNAKLLAGGQSLVPVMNFRLASPSVIVDLNRIAELAYIRADNSGLRIGAMTRQRQVERDAAVARHAPLLAETMPYIAHPQIRNRGTVGGSLAHADPAAELPAVAIALEAKFELRSAQGERWVAARDFFNGLFMTALQATEILVEIDVPPMPPRAGWSFQEVSRRHGDYALAGVAALVALDEKGQCRDVRVVLMSVGPQPMVAQNAAKLLSGQKPTADALRATAEAANAEIDPSSDIHASADFRRQLAKTLTRRALEMAIARAKSAVNSQQ